jgi:DNA-binding LacI/PurR family transcriptional regulator
MNRLMDKLGTTATRPTLADVARRVGVSKSAVSQAVNWVPDRATTIKEETRQRILQVVKEMGYRPSWRGQVLAKRRSQAIAVVYSAPLGAVPRGVYFEIVDHIEEQLSKFDFCPAFVHVKEHAERFDRLLGDARFDGCLTLGVLSPEVLKILRANQVPAVLVNADADETWTRVNVDDEEGTRAVMAHLLSLGHRRIAYNSGPRPPSHHSVTVRASTYQRCMREAGLTPQPPFVGPVEQFVEQVISTPDRPTAIIDFDHWGAVHLLQALWRKGMRVPDDVSVATFNDTYPVNAVIPPLTTASLPGKQMAEHAVRLLLERIEQPQTAAQTVVLKETLVVRESTAPPRV